MPPPKHVVLEDVAKYFHLPLKDAAKELKISETMLKKFCRKNNINNWPFRVFRALDSAVEALKADAQITMSHIEGFRGTAPATHEPNLKSRISSLEDNQRDIAERIALLQRNRDYLCSQPQLIPLVTQSGMHMTTDLRSQMSLHRNIQSQLFGRPLDRLPSAPASNLVPDTKFHPSTLESPRMPTHTHQQQSTHVSSLDANSSFPLRPIPTWEALRSVQHSSHSRQPQQNTKMVPPVTGPQSLPLPSASRLPVRPRAHQYGSSDTLESPMPSPESDLMNSASALTTSTSKDNPVSSRSESPSASLLFQPIGGAGSGGGVDNAVLNDAELFMEVVSDIAKRSRSS